VVPYFFELKRVDGKYRYDIAPRVAFIQVGIPQKSLLSYLPACIPRKVSSA
jgi:hypothetical protein